MTTIVLSTWESVQNTLSNTGHLNINQDTSHGLKSAHYREVPLHQYSTYSEIYHGKVSITKSLNHQKSITYAIYSTHLDKSIHEHYYFVLNNRVHYRRLFTVCEQC